MVEYHLKIVGENDATERLLDLTNGFSIGAAGNNDLCLSKDGIENLHCTFRIQNDILSLYNHEQSQNTLIDDFPLKPGKSYIVDEGDTIVISGLKLKIYKNIGEFKDENQSLEQTIADNPELQPVSLETDDADYHEDEMFGAADPTQMGSLPEGFTQMQSADDLISESTEDTFSRDFQQEMDEDEDLEMDLGDSYQDELDEEIDSGHEATMISSGEQSFEETGEEMFGEADPTQIGSLPAMFEKTQSTDLVSDSLEDTYNHDQLSDEDYDEVEMDLDGDIEDFHEDDLEDDHDEFAEATRIGTGAVHLQQTEASTSEADAISEEDLEDDIDEDDLEMDLDDELEDDLEEDLDVDMDDISAEDESLEEFEDDLLGGPDPTQMRQLPDELKKPIEINEHSDIIEIEDAEPTKMTMVAELQIPKEMSYKKFINNGEISKNSNIEQTPSQNNLISADDLIPEESSSVEISDNEGTSDNVFKNFDFADESSGLLGQKDVEQVKQEAIDNMSTEMTGIKILPTDDEEEGEVDFSFGDEGEGLSQSYSADNQPQNTLTQPKQPESFIDDFEVKTEFAQIQLDDDDEFESESSGNTGVIDLGEEKTRILKTRQDEGEELYPGGEGEKTKIGVEPLPPVSEFRPDKTQLTQMPLSAEESLKAGMESDSISENFDAEEEIEEGNEEIQIEEDQESSEDFFVEKSPNRLEETKNKILNFFQKKKDKNKKIEDSENQISDNDQIIEESNESSIEDESTPSENGVEKSEEKQETPPKGFLAKIKSLFKGSDNDDWDDEDDDDWDDEDDDDWEDDDDDDDEPVKKEKKKEKSPKNESEQIIQEVPVKEEEKVKPDLQLIKNDSEELEADFDDFEEDDTNDTSISELDLGEDASKQFSIEEIDEDTGPDRSVTNINIGELNEKLKLLEEEAEEKKKSSFFKGLFKKESEKEVKGSDELEFSDEDGLDENEGPAIAADSQEDNLLDEDLDLEIDDDLDEPTDANIPNDESSENEEMEFGLDNKPAAKNAVEADEENEGPTDPAMVIENEPTDPALEIAGAAVQKQQEDTEAIEKKYDNDSAAPSLVKGAKKGKKKSKFSHGTFPWILGRAYALLTSIALSIIFHDTILDIIDFKQTYTDISKATFEVIRPLFVHYLDIYKLGLMELDKLLGEHLPIAQSTLKDLNIMSYLNKITDYNFFKYLFMFILIENLSALILGISLPKFIMGVKSTDKYPISSLKALLRNILGLFTLPLIILDLPILWSMRSFKEVITGTQLYYKSKIQMIVAPILTLPLVLIFWYLSPFLDFNLKFLPPVIETTEIKIKQSIEDGLTNYQSKELALKGSYTKNEKFTYLPYFEKDKTYSIIFVDSFLKQSAKINVLKIVELEEFKNELMKNNPSLDLFFAEGIELDTIKTLMGAGLGFDLKNPKSLLAPVMEKYPHSQALIYIKQTLINNFQLENVSTIKRQDTGDKLIFQFELQKRGNETLTKYLVLSKYDIRLFELSANDKSKAKNRLIQNIIGARSTRAVLESPAELNAFTIFDVMEEFKNATQSSGEIRKQLYFYFYNIGQSLLDEEDEVLKKEYLNSLKNVIGQLNKTNDEKALALATKLDEIILALEKLDKSFFSKKSTQSVKKSSTNPKNTRKKAKPTKRRRN